MKWSLILEFNGTNGDPIKDIAELQGILYDDCSPGLNGMTTRTFIETYVAGLAYQENPCGDPECGCFCECGFFVSKEELLKEMDNA